MQHRQQIREQFGYLEEQLEELGTRASGEAAAGCDILVQDALESVRELARLVHEQQISKSVTAHDFLLRVCGLLVQHASSQGVDVAISHFGEGRISMEMAELVMGAVVAGFRASLRSQKGLTRTQRLKNHLFPTGSLYLEVRATPGEIQFRLLDDGQGFSGAGTAADSRFARLREHVARCGGWFGHKSFIPCGGIIEFKVPLARNRTEALVLRGGGCEALVPKACVVETVQHGGKVPAGASVFRLHESDGLVEGGEDSPVFLRIGVADLQFWVACDSVSGPVHVRPVSAEGFVEEGCWMQSLGLFRDEGGSRALPLLDGAALVQFFRIGGGA